jgi:hypothetical protein
VSDETQPDAANDTAINAHVDETGAGNTDTAETAENAPEAQIEANADESTENVDTFDRAYVEKLRKESAGYRDKAKSAEGNTDALSKRLHTALVAATGRLADPSDLPYDAEHLDAPARLATAIDELLAAKPHLKARKVTGDVGLGRRDSAEVVDLAAMLRARA